MIKHIVAVASAAFFVGSGACLAAQPGDQTEEAVTYQINAAHSGSVTFAAGFAAPLHKLWSYDTGNSLSYPLIADGKLYVVSGGTDVFALDAFTGQRKWEHLLGGNDNLGAYDNGKLFFENSNGQVTALKAGSGKQLWAAQASSDFSSSVPIAVRRKVFVGGPAVTAIDEATGAVDWTQGIEATDSAVAYGNGGLYAGGPSQYYKFAIKDGTLLWHYSGCCEGGGGISPVYFDKRVYLTDWAEGNYVLNSMDGSVDGSFSGGMPPTLYKADVHGGYALEIANGKLYCLDARTGNVVWSVANDQMVAPPIVVNGQPIVATNSGTLYMLDGSTGAQLWTDSVSGYVSGMNAGDGIFAVAAGTSITVYGPQ